MTNLGAGLSCSVDMVNFMSSYDLTQKPYSLDLVGMRFLDIDGQDDPNKKWPGYKQKSTNWDTLYYRLRANFDGFRSGYCDVPAGKEEDGSVMYKDGCAVENVEYEEGAEMVKVFYKDQKGEEKSIEGDLLIGTDGPGSVVRRIFKPEVERKYVGYIGWRGTVPEKEISRTSREVLRDVPIMCPIGNSCTISSVSHVPFLAS